MMALVVVFGFVGDAFWRDTAEGANPGCAKAPSNFRPSRRGSVRVGCVRERNFGIGGVVGGGLSRHTARGVVDGSALWGFWSLWCNGTMVERIPYLASGASNIGEWISYSKRGGGFSTTISTPYNDCYFGPLWSRWPCR